MSRVNESMSETGQGGSTENLRDKAGEVVGNIREMGNQAKDAAKEQYEHVRDSASEAFEHGREKAAKWQHDLEEYVHEQPIKALLIAAGIGVVLGIVWKRH